ncbi:MAG: hypothetical protein IJZ23_10100 [Roseburia sp.]|nr:hypothetical protein [Roseburia sp.]
MAFPFLGLFIMLLATVSYFRKRSNRRQQEVKENFWAREQEANFVRRRDISGLSYISIPFEDFSIGEFTDEKLTEIENSVNAFRDKKILNLSGQTNTDLKLLYGPANLPSLMEYDQNFSDMLCTLTDYINRLIELEHLDAAVPVLEFCIKSGSDISTHYTLLGNYYKQHGQDDQLKALRESASNLDSLMKASILQKLDAIIAA